MACILKSVSRAFLKYQTFVDRVRCLIDAQAGEAWKTSALAVLNGQAGTELESLVTLKARRKEGAFFTNHVLADKLFCGVKFGQKPIVYDPACGAGDLLLAAARIIGKQNKLRDTAKIWADALRGTDKVPCFVDATKSRLMLQARVFHPNGLLDQSLEFGKIFVGDAMDQGGVIASATHVVMNPPFVRSLAPNACDWASGKTNIAAFFVEHALEHMQEGAQLLAILPEVLRTGTRYSKWRAMVLRHASAIDCESVGLFPGSADVDVFLLRLTRGSPTLSVKNVWSQAPQKNRLLQCIEDRFDVSIGPVVPYRDPKKGGNSVFAHPRNIPSWEVVSDIKQRRRWRGRLVKPPFVVLRRTSRPGDKYRATASVISCAEPVAVENHLIVCRPKAGGVKACRNLMNYLRSEEVNDHLNEQMRCRHLTVGVVRRIPMPIQYNKRDQ